MTAKQKPKDISEHLDFHVSIASGYSDSIEIEEISCFHKLLPYFHNAEYLTADKGQTQFIITSMEFNFPRNTTKIEIRGV